ncbi:protein tramtrack, alpha isoform-like isoform X2 [Euwallacea fornicatus]|uniref:protein tramtrack, alpha isoform-like isoform X2 n=1 Tax=Euwallacea fornicatus TaxID=995702 RepID=UPI00338FAB18
MASEQFSLCWDNFHKNMSSGMNSLLESGDLVDVTLAVEGKFLKAHKMVLSVCSPYFKELFKTNPCQHPIVFMKDVSYVAISDLLQFMYQGEVQVSQDNLTTFIKTAEALQIKGLTGDGNGSTDADSEPVQEKPARHIDESYKPSPRPKKQLPTPVVTTTPAVKRPRLSASSNDSQSAPIAIAKTEPSSTGVDSSSVQFKVEPYDLNQSVTIPDDGDDNFDENLDDNTVDDTEDYSMMEGEEPQAGTSTDGTGEGQADTIHVKSENLDYFDVEEAEEVDEDNSGQSISIKSTKIYQRVYDNFNTWREKNQYWDYSENTFLAYFQEHANLNAKSSTMWTQFSMLKRLMSINHGIDLSSYNNLRLYLRKLNQGYQPKKSPVFTRDQFMQFLREAPDEKYLGVKVVLMVGVLGACRCDDLIYLKTDQIQDLESVLCVTIKNRNYQAIRTFTIAGTFYIEIYRKFLSLRPTGYKASRFFLNYTNGRCMKSPMGKHTIGGVPRKVAHYLNLPDWKEYTGHCMKQTTPNVTGIYLKSRSSY